MATKTITITHGAYEKLAAYKESTESFSDVINRIMSKHSLLDLIGVLTNEEANELKKNVADLRKRMRKRVEITARRLA
ncbi:antitoxin VapB family protein [Candidatus Woesearchaeota archaeon]|nr:antitoxin VapB family protein [Candidatus Woesearchaeota archaeon]